MADKTYVDGYLAGLRFGIAAAKSWAPVAQSADAALLLQQVGWDINAELSRAEPIPGDIDPLGNLIQPEVGA